MTWRSRWLLAPVAFAVAAAALTPIRTEAHKPITSPYTYNEDVFPIVRDHCGRCHAPGGVAPMSLLTYKEAYPWGESIRTELIAGHMPPWTADGGRSRFKNAQPLTAKEMNVLLTWATGGNPVGGAELPTPAAADPSRWPLGPPDVVLPLPREFAMPSDKQEDTVEFVVPTGIAEARTIRAVDLKPGTPAIVRNAIIAVKGGSSGDEGEGGIEPERVLGLWVPGEDPVAVDQVDQRAGFQLPRSAELVVRVHYKKTWEYERRAMTDRSTVGIYLAPRAGAPISVLTLAADAPAAAGDSVAFARVVDQDLRALAIYPDPALVNASVRVDAVRPDGSRSEIIRFRPQQDWARRYWFEQPITLPRGTRIEVAAAFPGPEALLPPGATAAGAASAARPPVRLTLNVASEAH